MVGLKEAWWRKFVASIRVAGLFVLFCTFFISMQPASAEAATYAKVESGGWTFWVDGTQQELSARDFGIIIANKNSAGQDQYAVFAYSGKNADGDRVYNQQQDYYNHPGSTRTCAAHIDVKTSGSFAVKLITPVGCPASSWATQGIKLSANIPADILEKAKLENMGSKPIGCPEVGGTLPKDPPNTFLNYNCPNGTHSVQAGILKTGTIAATAPGANVNDPDNPDLEFECGRAFSLNWFMCPLYSALNGIVGTLDNMINDMLMINQVEIFDTSDPDGTGMRYYTVWNTMRTIALALLVAAGLIMIGAQALGFQILDPYTIKKIFPRLVIATIAIALSWYLMKFFVILTNDLGLGIRQLITYPFQDLSNSLYLNGGAAFTALLLSSAALFVLGAPGLLTFAGTALLTLIVAFVVLMIRQIVIVALVLIAPIAIACSILPNTDGAYKLWYESFTKALLMFPIIVAFITVGRVFAVVAFNGNSSAFDQLIGFAAYFMPYFLIPLTFSLAGGALRFLSGRVNDTSRGGFDRLKKVRSNAISGRHQARMTGQSWVGSGRTGSLYRRAGLISQANSGALSPTGKGRKQFEAAQARLMAGTADEMLKRDNGRSAGDDLATELIQQKGMNRRKFVNDYASRLAASNPTMTETERMNAAQSAAASIETNFGGNIGSTAMRVAGFKARAASSTGYGGGDYQSMISDANGLISDGLITTTDAAAAFKGNQKRADMNGIGFGEWMTYIDQARLYDSGQVDASGNRRGIQVDASGMADSAIAGAQPGQILAGHKSAIKGLAPRMLKNLEGAHARMMRTGNDTEFKRMLASTAGLYDVMAQIAPGHAGEFADLVMSKSWTVTNANGITGQSLTVQKLIEDSRGDDRFTEMRREYASSNQSQYAAAMAAQGHQPTAPPGGVPQPGQPI